MISVLKIGLGILLFSTLLAKQTELQIMSFNIKYDEGPNAAQGRLWSHRKKLIVHLIKELQPDLIGLQEVLANQVSDLATDLNDYHMVGLGRDVDAKNRETFLKIKGGYRIFKGNTDGEFSPILFRKDRFTVLDFGIFWFSETPNIPSIWSAYGASNRRICTWLRLEEKSSKKTFYFYNLHLENGRDKAELRKSSSEILIDRIQSRDFKNDPIIVTGDFNAMENEATISLLNGTVTNEKSIDLIDSWRRINPNPDAEGTFHFWTGNTQGRRIDYIFVSKEWIPSAAHIITFSKDSIYPSDHFPITSSLKFN